MRRLLGFVVVRDQFWDHLLDLRRTEHCRGHSGRPFCRLSYCFEERKCLFRHGRQAGFWPALNAEVGAKLRVIRDRDVDSGARA
jgi:hypothetical protein